MPQFLVLIYGDEQVWDAIDEEWQAENARRHRAFGDTAGAALISGGPLARSAEAVSIRGDADTAQTLTTGAFVTVSSSAIGGYYLLEAASLDAATTLARILPEASAPASGVEVRPVVRHE